MHGAHRWPFALAGVVIAAVAVLGKMQFDWIARLSESREQRLRAELESAAKRFGADLDVDIVHISAAFELRDANADELAARYDRWRALATDPRILRAIWVIDPKSVLRFDPEQRALRPAMLPPELVPALRNPERFVAEVPAVTFLMHEHPPTLLVMQIDSAYLVHDLIPDLARRFFGAEFDVAVARGDQIVFRSDAHWPASVAAADSDVTAPLFWLRRREREERPHSPAPLPPPLWRLLVRHHGAPLAQVVAAERHRDMALASLILALLAAVAIALALAARRAERLRRQQLEFVAGITHELNTPLAALAAAGQNLADGLTVHTERYGEAIVKETRRLTDLVDQILQFGGMQTRAARVDATSQPRAAIDDALAQCRWMAEERGVRVECDAADDLPPVRGDEASVARAVQNLVANAIRHGGEGGWVGVRAGRENGFVDITVEDRGPGIAAADLPHLFEPFYRGRNAQTRGSGIGLTIVDRIARANGGKVTVARRRERGAAFTLRLPIAEQRP